MAEQYIETILIRQNERPEVETPTFADTDVDGIFKFEGTIQLRKINKTIQNAVQISMTISLQLNQSLN